MKKLCKGKYKVKNWSEYNKSLKNREDITFWLLEDALENWEIKDTVIQTKYSKIALETIYTLRQIFNLGLRQVEGFIRSLLKTKMVRKTLYQV